MDLHFGIHWDFTSKEVLQVLQSFGCLVQGDKFTINGVDVLTQ
jgi:hypothetical protein